MNIDTENWQAKYETEKCRRQTLVHDLIDILAMYDQKLDLTLHDAIVARLTKDKKASCLSPTLKSFDFDDEDEEGEKRVKGSTSPRRAVWQETSNSNNTAASPAAKLMLNMIYTRSSFSDLWSLKSHRRHVKLSSLARTILFSVHVKKNISK